MARQVIDLRLALVMALLAFVLAVSLDSAGNAAEAADLANATYRPGPLVTIVASQPSPSMASAPALEAPRRLHHGLMTSAILTNNRLTEAHLFTDVTTDVTTDVATD
jgi:hypothetical protein